jgi:hypothetical protein
MDFARLYGPELNLLLNDSDSNVLYKTALRQQAVNDGVAEFASLTECYVRRATIPVSCNTTEYVLSTISDYARISAQGLAEYWHTSSGGSSISHFTQLAGEDFPRRDELWLNRHEPSWRTSTTPMDFPQAHYIRMDGGQTILGLSEPPDVGSSETVRLIVPYVARPQTMVDVPFTDTSGNNRADLTEYHQAFAHYAAYKLLPLAGRIQEAQANLQLFQSYVQRYTGHSAPKGGMHVTFATNYFRNARRGSINSDPSIENDRTWNWR